MGTISIFCLNSGMKVKHSTTYVDLLMLFIQLNRETIGSNTYMLDSDGSGFTRTPNGKTKRLNQDVIISNNTLFDQCNDAEWKMVGRITRDLCQNNALWHVKPELRKSGTFRATLKSLELKRVIVRTDNPEIYMVNPWYVRRGDPFVILATTASLIHSSSRVTLDHIKNCKPVNQLKVDNMLLLNHNAVV